MPQPSLLSGVSGTIHSEAYQGPGPGEQMVQMAEAFTRVKQAQQASAQQKLKVMLDNVDKLPIDDKAIRKVAKQAGLPLGSDDHIAAIAAAGKQAKAEQTQANKFAGKPIEGPGGPMGSMPAAKDPNVAAAEAQKNFQKNMTPEQAKGMLFDTFAAKARQLSATRQDGAQAQAELEKKLATLKTRALDGDEKAVGQLAMLGEVDMGKSMTAMAWNNATPELKSKMYGILMGNETVAQQHERSDGIAKALMANGQNAADAYSIANTIGTGGTLSAEQQKKMGTPTFEQLGKAAEFTGQVQALGVPSDQVQGVVSQAMITGNLVGALPKGLQSVASQQLALRERELKDTEKRTGIMGLSEQNAEKRASAEDKRADAYVKSIDNKFTIDQQKNKLAILKLNVLEITGENKQVLDSIKATIMAKKNGVTIDPKDYQKTLDQLKSLKITDDPEGFIKHMTGETTIPGGDPVADELGGGK